jgi:hypothetical protein
MKVADHTTTATNANQREWVSAATMAFLLDVGASTFRSYVAKGLLPKGKRFAGVVRWHRETTLAAFEGRASRVQKQISVAANDNIDPIKAGISKYGSQAKAWRRSA